MAWRDIPEFPGYIITDEGVVVNARNDWPLRPSVNQQGILHVGMVRDGKQYHRSIAVLVAKAFLDRHQYPHYTSLIHLDGDKTNCRADNLMYRPRWFSIEYHQQFGDLIDDSWRMAPVTVLKTGEEFRHVIDLCVKYGLLVRQVFLAKLNHGTTVPIIWSEVR